MGARQAAGRRRSREMRAAQPSPACPGLALLANELLLSAGLEVSFCGCPQYPQSPTCVVITPHPAPECTRWSRAVGLLRTHRPRPAGLSRGSWRTNRLPFLLLLVSPALCLHQGYTKVTKSTEGITVWQAKLKLDTKNDQGEKNQTCPLK